MSGKTYNYGIKEEHPKKSDDDNGGFQQQIPQWFIDRYEHMNSRNEQWMVWLKAIKAEYYSIEN